MQPQTTDRRGLQLYMRLPGSSKTACTHRAPRILRLAASVIAIVISRLEIAGTS